MKTHLYGTSPYLPNAPYLNADELSRQSGGNTGNLMFCHSLARMLNTGTEAIPWGGDLSHLSPSTDRLVLPLANQLGPHVDLKELAERFAMITVPLVGIGLGVQGPITGVDLQSIPQGSWQWLKTIASKAPSNAPNIALRGETTYKVISQAGLGDRCIVTGCPSNFIHPSATLGREIYRRRANGLFRVVVAAGNPFLPQFRKLEHSLISMVEESDGLYVCQHPIDMLRLVKQEHERINRVNFLKYKEYIRPDLDDDGFLSWFRRYAHSFTSVPEWLTYMSHYDLVVGTRIHGVMAGIQAGVPGLCLCIDSRTLELCQTMGIPHVDANEFRDGITRAQIADILRQWEWRTYDEKRQILAERLQHFIQTNGMKPNGALLEVLKGRSRATAAYQAKPSNSQVHQVSTASFDDRYRSLFTAIDRALEMPAPKILSFGSSDGYELNDLAAKHFHHANIIGCDIDDDALRIARLYNRHASRVKIIRSEPEEIAKFAPFDVVIAMAVLCRWPDTREMDDISKLYSFEKFSESIEYFASLLRPGGLLCVYNANYLVTQTASAASLEIIEIPQLIPRTQPVKLFNKNGRPLEVQEVVGVLFRKQ